MSKRIILLTNLGSPDSLKLTDVRRYLNEFLMDKRVIDLPFLARFILVRGIITPFRAPRSAAKYKKIWTEKGSPLILIAKQLAEKVSALSGLPVYVSMRYGNPTPDSVLKKIAALHPDAEELILFPLYPHYAMSSYETAVEHVKDSFKKGYFGFKLKVIPPYYDDRAYIVALASSIESYLKTGTHDHLLFSYHGIPERHILKSDRDAGHCLKSPNCCSVYSPSHENCYRHQVLETTRLLAERLRLPQDFYSISFQSRLGRDKWLGPSTSEVLSQLPAHGVKNLLVVCPAFVSDCLETLEEIDMEGRETFLQAGGVLYNTVPCLNSSDLWAEAVVKMVTSIP
ncbi:MAG TPA: ferrochelatase [Marinilabiliaceae bacterium]|nr:ferrochelatase [Marinilabiliaceae bacterium]